MPSITPINFSFLEKRMNKGNNMRVMTTWSLPQRMISKESIGVGEYLAK
jgi:hypothetical protein